MVQGIGRLPQVVRERFRAWLGRAVSVLGLTRRKVRAGMDSRGGVVVEYPPKTCGGSVAQEGPARRRTRVRAVASELRSVDEERRGKTRLSWPLLPGAVPLKPVREWERAEGLRGPECR